GLKVHTVQVPMSRLDESDLGAIGFIKVDVEGHELAVMRGAAETLKRHHPALLIEAASQHRPAALPTLASYLSEFGYHGLFLRDGRPFDIEQLCVADQVYNFLFTTKPGDLRRRI